MHIVGFFVGLPVFFWLLIIVTPHLNKNNTGIRLCHIKIAFKHPHGDRFETDILHGLNKLTLLSKQRIR